MKRRLDLPEFRPREWCSILGNKWCCATKEGEPHECKRTRFDWHRLLLRQSCVYVRWNGVILRSEPDKKK